MDLKLYTIHIKYISDHMTGVSESSFSFVSYNHPPPPVNVRAVRILPECILVYKKEHLHRKFHSASSEKL